MKIPQPAVEICGYYCRELLAELGGAVVGVYLHGSIVLGDFQLGCSDIDFVTVVCRELNEREIRMLTKVHDQVARKFPQTPLEGVYLLPEQLGRSPEEFPPVPAYHDGSVFMGHFSINPVTWYELKTRGITVHGRDIASFNFEGELEHVRSYSRQNIDTYWRRWVDAISKPRSRRSVYALFNREAVAWGVLGVTRLYHVIAEGRVVSKSGAGEYALAQWPQWSKIITEALHERRGLTRSEYRNPFARRRDLIHYMNWIITKCK